MDASTMRPGEFDETHREHEEIREKLRRLHEMFSEMIQAPKEIKALVDEFEETLVNHFAHEEFGGFFDSVIHHAPQLEGEANRLCMEHHLLRSLVAELCEFAVAESPTLPWWRELASRCHVLSQKLIQHESAENALQRLAFQHARALN
jgi:iron-sulfur cluster repair protein YtfE (RIC family)